MSRTLGLFATVVLVVRAAVADPVDETTAHEPPSNSLLTALSPMLARWIESSRDAAIAQGVEKIPESIRASLAGYVPDKTLAHVRWRAGGKNTLEWDAAANATEYVVYRGTRDQLPFLSSDAVDGCLALQEHRQFADVLATTPPPGTLFWYLVVGTSGGVTGPAGTVRVGGSEAARSVDPSGSCAAP